ncbi:MAG: hypothetical protein R3D78_02120 [Paracoccaceae bacterium]
MERLIAQIAQSRPVEIQHRRCPAHALPEGPRILVPGQVEDDASIRLGADKISTNLALLAKTRHQNPQSIIIFKPHPDVEAGLRKGAISETEARRFADVILHECAPN